MTESKSGIPRRLLIVGLGMSSRLAARRRARGPTLAACSTDLGPTRPKLANRSRPSAWSGRSGSGIAQLAIEGGHETILHDVDEGALARGRDRISDGLTRRAARLVIDPTAIDDWVAERLARLNTTRSEERRVGKECIPPCRSRWSPYH